MVGFVGQEAARQHWHQGERHKGRRHNRQRHDDGKLVEQQADHAGHEKDRNEHRDQRDGDRQNREAHLARTPQRGFKGRLACIHMPHDVFEHDDGIVHYQTHGKGQAKQRDVVQAIAQAKQQSNSAHQRNGER